MQMLNIYICAHVSMEMDRGKSGLNKMGDIT